MIPTHNFPYTDVHEINLDWIIEKIQYAYTHFEELLTAETNARITADNVLTSTIEERYITLNTRITENVATLNSRIDTLNATVSSNYDALNELIESNYNTLNNRINGHYSTLNRRIDTLSDTVNDNFDTLSDYSLDVYKKAYNAYTDVIPKVVKFNVRDGVGGVLDRLTVNNNYSFASADLLKTFFDNVAAVINDRKSYSPASDINDLEDNIIESTSTNYFYNAIDVLPDFYIILGSTDEEASNLHPARIQHIGEINGIYRVVLQSNINSIGSVEFESLILTYINGAWSYEHISEQNNITTVQSRTLTTSGWTLNSTTGLYEYNINSDLISEYSIINIYLSDIADCETYSGILKTYIKTVNGTLTIFANSAPETDIPITFTIVR